LGTGLFEVYDKGGEEREKMLKKEKTIFIGPLEFTNINQSFNSYLISPVYPQK